MGQQIARIQSEQAGRRCQLGCGFRNHIDLRLLEPEFGGVGLDDLEHPQGNARVQPAYALTHVLAQHFVSGAEHPVGVGAQSPELHREREERRAADEGVE